MVNMFDIEAEREGNKYVVIGKINGEIRYRRTVSAPLDEDNPDLDKKINNAKRSIYNEYHNIH